MQLPQATRVAAQRGGPLAPRALPQKPTRGVAAARSTSATSSDVGPATASLVTSESPKPLKKVAMISLGCPKNTVDGEVLLGDLARAGFQLVQDPKEADAVVVNTCAFVEDAKAESLDAIMAAAALRDAARAVPAGSDRGDKGGKGAAKKRGKSGGGGGGGKGFGKAATAAAAAASASASAPSGPAKVIVTGCLAQRYGAELAASLPEADLVVGFEHYGGLPAALAAALGTELPASARSLAPPRIDGEDGETSPPSSSSSSPTSSRVRVGEATVPFRPEADRVRLTPRHSAYLRVAEGCSHACTFCAIPGFRGTFRSKPWAAVVSEARSLVASGALELNLVAEDTNQYGSDRKDGSNLATLLRELAAIEGLRWIRLLYCYPSYFSDELIDEIAANDKVCKYIDIPLQHAHNLTLLAMNRPPAAHTRALLDKLRRRIPGLALRTTFISGFPGESDEAHAELVEFARAMAFERMGAFAYSPEDGTPAALYPEQVDAGLRAARRDELVSLQQDVGARFAEGLVGTEVDVLIDGYDEDDDVDEEGEEGAKGARRRQLIGRTQWDAPDVDPLAFVSAEWLCDAERRERERGGGGSSSSASSEEEQPPFVPSRPPPTPGMMVRCLVTSASLFDLEVTPIEVVADSWAGVERGGGGGERGGDKGAAGGGVGASSRELAAAR